MGEWKEATLGDAIELQRGYDLTESQRLPGNVPVIGSAGINGRHATHRAKGPGLTIGRSGASFGNVTYTREDYWPHNTVLFAVNFRGNDPYWAACAISEIDFDRFNSGSAQPSLNRNYLYTIPLRIPPLLVQRRVGAVLAAYDELIENNTRRIGVLEEMARVLYREWFVVAAERESLLSSDGSTPAVPDGWSWEAVDGIIKTVGGGTPSRERSEFWSGGAIQWYSPTDITRSATMFIDDSGDHITDAGLAGSSAKLFPARSVMMTSRATIGAIAINTHEACTNQGFITCIPNERVPLFFLLHWLRHHVPEFIRLGTGATFKEITRGTFRKLKILLPPLSTVTAFEEAVAPYCELILALERKNRALRTARDLLLPKLLSGELSVERIPDPPEVAP